MQTISTQIQLTNKHLLKNNTYIFFTCANYLDSNSTQNSQTNIFSKTTYIYFCVTVIREGMRLSAAKIQVCLLLSILGGNAQPQHVHLIHRPPYFRQAHLRLSIVYDIFSQHVNGSSQDGFDAFRRMTVEPSDVLLVGYPKCGMTWLQQVICSTRRDCTWAAFFTIPPAPP